MNRGKAMIDALLTQLELTGTQAIVTVIVAVLASVTLIKQDFFS